MKKKKNLLNTDRYAYSTPCHVGLSSKPSVMVPCLLSISCFFATYVYFLWYDLTRFTDACMLVND